MVTSQVRAQADALINSGNFEQAVPFLQEFCSRIRESTADGAQQEFERALFNLGFALMVSGNTADAIPVFEEYLEKFKSNNVTRTVRSRDMLAEACFAEGKFERAAELFAEHATSSDTPHDRRRLARMALIDCYTLPAKWEEGLPVFEQLLRGSGDPEIRSRAAAALARAQVELGNPDRVFSLIATMDDAGGGGRYDLDFNLAMIASGDRMLKAGRHEDALPFFQVALPRSRIIEWWEERREALLESRQRLAAARALNVETILGIDSQLKRVDAQLEQARETDSYDAELALRTAHSLMALGRKWEAAWAYENFLEDFSAAADFREQAAFATFSIAAELGMYDRAKSAGERYLADFPEGPNVRDVTLQLVQIYLVAGEHSSAVALSMDSIEGPPDESLPPDRMAFLAGYGLFQDEEFEKAEAMFAKVYEEFPDSDQVEGARYWFAMTRLYRGEYASAMELFAQFARDFASGSLGVDAQFRVGVCLYALEKFEEARDHLEEFLQRNQSAPQVAEARLLLGDIAGSFGRLREAQDHYRIAGEKATNQASADYAAMQIGTILEARRDWVGMRDHFHSYLEQTGSRGMYAEAVFRMGLAMQNLGDREQARELYLSAVRELGNDADAIGIDLILDAWAEEHARRAGSPLAVAETEADQARRENKFVLFLRWQRILDQYRQKEGAGAAATEVEISEEALRASGPAGLLWFAEVAERNGDPELATRILERLIESFPQTEWGALAHASLAGNAVARGDLDAAIEHYATIRTRFPLSDLDLEAREKGAALLAGLGRFDESNELLESILEMREWRGEPWPRALYFLGMNHFNAGNIEAAFAYFQRVYVLYAYFKEWAGLSYLKSAECLEALGKNAESIRTLEEFVGDKSFQDTPQYAEALDRLGRQPAPPAAADG